MQEPESSRPGERSSRSFIWASYGSKEEDEDFIVGSAEGLRALRDHIDKAINAGESRIEEPEIDFAGIRCKEGPYKDTPPSTLARIGCFAVAVLVLALAIYGIISLFP